MKHKDYNIVERGDTVEAWFCEQYRLTSDNYMEMWYELGCEYAEGMFEKMGVPQLQKEEGIRLFITSPIYWYHWAMEWLQTSEAFIDWPFKDKNLQQFRQMQMEGSRRAWPLIHEIIIENHKVK